MIIFLALLSAVAYSHVVIDSRVNQADELEEEWWKGGVVETHKMIKSCQVII